MTLKNNHTLLKETEFLKYSELRKGNRPATGKNYLYWANQFFSWLGKTPKSVTVGDCEAFLLHMKNRKLSSNTQRLALTGIREYFAWLIADGQASVNPVIEIKLPQEIITDPLMITKEDLFRLVVTAAAANPRMAGLEVRQRMSRRNAALICLLAETGIREGECAFLRMGNITQQGKGHFLLSVPGGIPGLKSAPRTVPFGKLVQGSLVAEYWVRWWLSRKYQDKATETDAVFPVWRDHKYLQNNVCMSGPGIRKTVAQIVKKARLSKKAYPHLLRHYYGTHSVADGVPIYVVSKRMGHRSLDTTQRYVHFVDTQVDPHLEHGPNVGLLAPKEDSGFVKLLQEISKNGL